MGQQEVYDFFKHNPGKWFTSKQIAKKIGPSLGSVTTTLAKLRKSKSIVYKMSQKRTNMYLYRFKE